MPFSFAELTASPNPLSREYRRFRVAERLLLTGHSHQAWPDRAFEGQKRAWEDAAELVDGKWERAFEQAERVRCGYRGLMDDPEGRYSLAGSTHDLLVRFLSALPLDERPRLVTTDGEFHSLRRQLDRLEEAGLEVVRVAARPAETVGERLAAAVDDRTAAALVSTVFFLTAEIAGGLERLAEACRRHGVPYVLDTYHQLNVVPFSLRRAGLEDAYAVGGGYKYLQHGEGSCFLRYPPDSDLRPVATGWFAEFGDLERPPAGGVAYSAGDDRFAGATYDPTSHYRAAEVFDFFAEQRLDPGLLRRLSQHQVGRLCELFDGSDLDPRLIDRDRAVPLARLGGFLALRTPRAAEIQAGLAARGVATDHRGEILRYGPAPYLSGRQLEESMTALAAVCRSLAPPASQEAAIPRDDLDLLRRYEPVLVFAKEEGFHPLAVEPYLARCHLFRRSRGALRWLRRPRRVTDDWDRRAAAAGGSDAKGSGRARALSSFDGLHYLRLLDPAAKRELAGRPDRKAREPSWWALAILLALVGWGCWWLWKALPAGAGGRLIVAALAGLAAAAAVVIWSRAALTERASASLTRVLGAMLPVALVSLGLWWFGLGPVAVFIGVALAGLMLVVLRDHLVVAYMELLSPLRGAAGDLAEALERELRRDPETGRYTYYGRVWRGSESPLVALQYCFFYAFNDWRRKGGLNLHEADWEWATVFLRRQGDELRPEAVWLSQHHRGELRAWPQAPPAGGVTPQSAAAPPPTAPRVELAGGHPVLYVARGSHALYFDAGKRRLPELIPRPLLRRFVEWVVRASESARREAAEGQRRAAGLLPGGGRKGRPIDESMTEDDRDAGGRVVGPALPEGLSASRLAGGWRRVAIGEETPWIDFPGLWGVRTLLRNESGPPGPQWEREEKVGWAERGRPRRRAAWDDPTRALAASPPLPAER